MRLNFLDADVSAPCQRMSLAIASIIRAKGSCRRSDLQDNNFSAEEIRSCWNIAYGLAHVELMGSRNDIVFH